LRAFFKAEKAAPTALPSLLAKFLFLIRYTLAKTFFLAFCSAVRAGLLHRPLASLDPDLHDLPPTFAHTILIFATFLNPLLHVPWFLGARPLTRFPTGAIFIFFRSTSYDVYRQNNTLFYGSVFGVYCEVSLNEKTDLKAKCHTHGF
jgi:hypothetical protein